MPTIKENEKLLRSAAEALGPLLEKVVFVGGATTILYLTEKLKDVRATLDVDVIIEANRNVFYQAENTLRDLGFQNDAQIICRFHKGELIIDFMPIDVNILGFSNKWYLSGLKTAQQREVAGISIKVLDFPHFVATKLEAFSGRGKNDYYASKDIEDLVTVFYGRSGFLLELKSLEGELGQFIRAEFQKHLKQKDFLSAIEGNIPTGSKISYQRIITDLKELATGLHE